MTDKPKRNEKKLKESEEKFKLILDNANDLITIINENFEHEYINEKAYLGLLGYTKDDIIGQTPLTPLHPDDSKIAIKTLRDGFKYGEGKNEMRVRHKDGHYLWFEHKGKTFVDTDGKKKAIIISRDITERKKAENFILEENKKLLELSKVKSELIMRVSHELKTPLSSIYAASQILLKNFKDEFGEKALEFIEMIYRGGQKLKQLIENLLDVSRVESGKLDLDLQNENLVEIINSSVSDLEYWADKKSINVIVKLPEEIVLEIDRIKIEQVIINLLSNAIKFTPPKGNISIRSNVSDQWVEISIKDTGIGLTKKEKGILFQKFGKIQRESNEIDVEIEGSGLGLYISKEVVELHNGKIYVESKGRNKGSTFTIKLPK